jgi:hypothetical protein
MRNIARVGVVCVVLLLLEHGMIPPLTKARFCAGDRARMAKLVEYFYFKMIECFESYLDYTERTIDRGFMIATQLALWNLQQQSTAALSSQLARSEMDPDKLKQVLKPYLERAVQFRALLHAGDPGASGSSLQQHVIDRLVEVWSVCRAIQRGEVAPCDTWLTGETQAECRFLFAKLGTLYGHRCESKSVKEVSRIIGQPVDLIERWCLMLKSRHTSDLDEETLKTIIKEPRERAAARAIATEDPQACHGRGLGEVDLRYCLNELHTYRFVNGRLPPWEWQPLDQTLLFLAAARVVREEPIDCGKVTVWAYRIATAPDFLVVYP